MNKQDAYDWGYDSVINGANTTNCNFGIFNTKILMEEWTRGRNDAKLQKEVKKDE